MISKIEIAKLGLITFKQIALRDYLGIKNKVFDNKVHIKGAIDWLKRAQDSTSDGGVSAGYFRYGWETSYPETTGYIISTYTLMQ